MLPLCYLGYLYCSEESIPEMVFKPVHLTGELCVQIVIKQLPTAVLTFCVTSIEAYTGSLSKLLELFRDPDTRVCIAE